MPIRDSVIDRRFHRHWIGAKDFSGVGNLALVLGEAAPNTITSNDLTQFGDTDIVLANINSTKVPGLLMVNAGELVSHAMPLPRHWDYRQALYFRVAWTSASATTADTIDWKVFLEKLAAGGALTATVNDALDTVVAQDTVAGAHLLQFTAWGKLNAAGIDPDVVDFLLLNVEMDAKAAGLTESVWLLGLEIAYVPKLTRDDGPTKLYAAVPANQ